MANANSITEGPAIGIDLGTTFSCVAVVRNGRVEIIPNEQGMLITPSFVAFNEHERMIGDAAKDQLAAHSSNTVFDAKRLIGRRFDDPIVQKDSKHWPFKVVEVKGMPKVEVKYMNEVKRFSAEEISAMILGKLKEAAESYLNTTVTNAVVTVPAYFNDMQRKATKDAGEIAGLNVTRIINEPTAAAIAYGLGNDTKIAKNILVYDFGGGTFDVSILNICENVFEVKATAGDTHLGGEDFDSRMMETFVAEFKSKNVLDISGNKKALRRLRTSCERAKRILSSNMQTSVQIDSLCYGIDFIGTMSRVRFEDLCADLFRSTIITVEDALKDAELKHEDIDTIVLVGGSTRIPKIRRMLEELFPGKEIYKSINADEVVAHGAAIQAAIIHGHASKEMENMILTEVTPLTLGIQVERNDVDIMSPLIKRNTRIPVARNEIFVTKCENQSEVGIKILQGERRLVVDNFEIGYFKVCGIPAAPARKEEVNVTFSIDDNGILTVTAASLSNPQANGQITIKNVCGSLTKAEIEQMVAEAELYREQDREVKEYKTARWDLERYCIEIREKFGAQKSSVVAKCDEIQSWLSACFRPTLAQFSEWKNELEAMTLTPRGEELEADDTQ